MRKKKAVKRKTRAKKTETKATPKKEKEIPTLTLLTLTDAFLFHNKNRQFLIQVPYESPIEYMLMQLTRWAWKVTPQRASGPDFEFLVPGWMSSFIEALKKKQEEVPPPIKKTSLPPSLVLSGEELRNILHEVLKTPKK